MTFASRQERLVSLRWQSIGCYYKTQNTNRVNLAHVQEVAELVVLGCDEADPARCVLVLSAVLYVHLEERCESLEEVSEARFIGECSHPPLPIPSQTHHKQTTTPHSSSRTEVEGKGG